MNNNRNNNRRRGRGGGGNRGGGGGGNQSNRIDSRARGNAPQMLEKYKKLAHEASLNDDRVQTEYYLQFADHYFRVIADNKAQKDEARAKRDAEREQDRSDDGDDDDNDGQQQERGRSRRGGERKQRGNGADPEPGVEGSEGSQDDGENPFTRDKGDDAAPRKTQRKPRKRKDAEAQVNDDGSLDPGMLPPSIARATEDDSVEEEKPRRKLARSRRKPDDDDGEEALKAVG